MPSDLPSWCPDHIAQSLPAGNDGDAVLQQLLRLADEVPDPWQRIAHRVDHSPYDLSQWFEAMVLFDQWLQQEQRDSPIDLRLGYIECATQSTEARTLRPHLPHLLSDFLQAYGYVG